jgi:hypothetical protein
MDVSKIIYSLELTAEVGGWQFEVGAARELAAEGSTG